MDLFKLIEDGVAQPVRDYIFYNHIHLYSTRNGITPFLHACKYGNIEIVAFLLEAGSIIIHKETNGNTALHIAARNGHLDTVDFLLTQGVNINDTNNSHETALHVAVKHHQNKIALYLMSKGANTRIENSMKLTPLMNAIYMPSSKLALDMIDQGAYFHGSTRSPLDISISCRQFDITMHLLSKGPHFKRAYRLAMVLLVQEGTDMSKQILKFMLDKGINPNSRNRKYHTPLVQACFMKSYDMVKLLLDHRANPNARTVNNDTALHAAVKMREDDIVQLLLKHRANPNLKNNFNDTPLSLACEYGFYNIMEHLVYKSNLTLKTGPYNRTYLMHAVDSNNYRMVEKMLYMGPMNLQDDDLDGSTAYELALYNDRSAIIRIMEGAIRARTTITMDRLDVNIPIPIWRRLLPSEGKRALDVALQAYKVDSLACYHALFLNEDVQRKKYRHGEVVCFSQAPIRSLTRAMGSRPIRHRIVSNLIFPHREIYRQILNR